MAIPPLRKSANPPVLFFLDDEVLREEGVTDFAKYRTGGTEADLQLDFWVDAA